MFLSLWTEYPLLPILQMSVLLKQKQKQKQKPLHDILGNLQSKLDPSIFPYRNIVIFARSYSSLFTKTTKIKNKTSIPMVTTNMHEIEFCALSIAVHVTVVCPASKFMPDVWVHVTCGIGSKLSIATGVVHVTGFVEVSIFMGHIIIGFIISATWNVLKMLA